MSQFKLEIDLDSAAYHDDEGFFYPYDELVKNLDDVKFSVDNKFYAGSVRDSNGNVVGKWSIKS